MYGPTQFEVLDLLTIGPVRFTDVGEENLYFEYGHPVYCIPLRGFCKLDADDRAPWDAMARDDMPCMSTDPLWEGDTITASGAIVPDPYFADPYGVVRRMARTVRNVLVSRGEIEPFYVVAIGIDRCYGGPEEGGWYYDMEAVLDVRRVWDWRTGLTAARELRDEHPTCPRGRGSAIGGEDVYLKTFRTLDAIPEDSEHPGRWE